MKLGNTTGNGCPITCYERTHVPQWTTWDIAYLVPPELGNLSGLESVSLTFNGFTGSIPPEMGNLTSLDHLDLAFNDLTGSIPPELGSLSNLGTLSLSANGLTGSIPPELGGLSLLITASLHSNDLTGSIPPALGNLSNLRLLSLRANDLTGPIPPELGNLSSLNQLWLIDNRLSGTLPSALNGLTALTHLYLANNPDLTGPVPSGFTALSRLNDLVLHGTDLCIPEHPDLQSWFSQVAFARASRCEGEGSSMAYLTQAVQSRAFPVPLVAGRKALLRVLVTASQATSATIPAVRATFYRNGSEIHSVDIPGTTMSIPTRIDDAESALDRSANAEIPGSVIQPGLEMVIEVDPDNTLDSALGVAKRIPETGRMQLQVEKMPALDLTFVPFLWSAGSDSSLVDVVRDIAADPEGHDMLSDTRAMLPVGELDVKAHEPVLTSTTNTLNLLLETWLIRTMEGGSGYYMGLLPEHVVGGQSGVAFLGSVAGFSVADPFVIAHELGHNVSLNHAPCGGAAGPDPAFPERNGSTGVWGYDFRNGGALIPPHARDMMSYCGPPRWVSDFSFAKAMGYRLNREVGATVAADAATKTILLWGGVDAQGNPFLEPAFVGYAPPALPRSVGEYELTGRDASGGDLFSLSFDMMEIADAEGNASFVFSLPARADWADALQNITLSGPAGVAAMDLTTNRPMAILRDKDSGRVQAILRDADALNLISGSEAAVALPGARPEGLFSRGIPETAQWRR